MVAHWRLEVSLRLTALSTSLDNAASCRRHRFAHARALELWKRVERVSEMVHLRCTQSRVRAPEDVPLGIGGNFVRRRSTLATAPELRQGIEGIGGIVDLQRTMRLAFNRRRARY